MNGMAYLWLLLLGVCNGSRTMTPIAVLCWFAYLHHIALTGWRGFAANLVSVAVFSLAALGEYVGDKLPSTPNRTDAGPLGARIVFASLCAVLLSQALSLPVAAAVTSAIVGALIGAFGGYYARTRSVAAIGCADWNVAVVEDALVLGGSVLAMTFLSRLTPSLVTAVFRSVLP